MADTHRVFVYGTLKRTYNNHHLLESADYVGQAYTVDTFRMYTTGFPVLFESDHPDAKAVFGEVYDVDDQTLARLDALEGANCDRPMYDRKQLNVAYPPGQGLANFGQDLIEANVNIYIGNTEYWQDHRLPEYMTVNAYDELVWRP